MAYSRQKSAFAYALTNAVVNIESQFEVVAASHRSAADCDRHRSNGSLLPTRQTTVQKNAFIYQLLDRNSQQQKH